MPTTLDTIDLYSHSTSGAHLLRLDDRVEVLLPPCSEHAAIALAWHLTWVPEGVDLDAWAHQRVDDLLRDWGQHPDIADTAYGEMGCDTDVPAYSLVMGAIALGMLDMPDEVTVDPWHPVGAEIRAPRWSIVVTDWNDCDTYDVGLYTRSEVEGDMEPTTMRTPGADAFLDAVRNALAEGEASWGLDTDPLPAPKPTAPSLAARYEAQVRSNGPTFVEAVAGMATGKHDANNVSDENVRYHVTEVAIDIADMFDLDTADDAVFDACCDAAEVVVGTFRNEIKRARS